MATHAQLAAKLLRDAAAFFRSLGKENPSLAAEPDTGTQTSVYLSKQTIYAGRFVGLYAEQVAALHEQVV